MDKQSVPMGAMLMALLGFLVAISWVAQVWLMIVCAALQCINTFALFVSTSCYVATAINCNTAFIIAFASNNFSDMHNSFFPSLLVPSFTVPTLR
jgi:hypothetical protein